MDVFQEPPELETLTEQMVPEEPDTGTLLPVPFPLALARLFWVYLNLLCEDNPPQQHFLTCVTTSRGCSCFLGRFSLQRVQWLCGTGQPVLSAVFMVQDTVFPCQKYHPSVLALLGTHRVSRISFQGQSPSAGLFVLF